GVLGGVFRPVDERVATFTVLGMCNWVAWWYERSDRVDLALLAAEIAEMALQSLRVSGEKETPASSAALLKAIRAHLTHLERLIES
ncbi:MAG TPA: TetR/AcrR family transcriptional regulator, partial [Candidatus Dormibacteraeota bacterium]|nr:TetR/AcrR family transcriptional regulator [Candidatus Dormibacteraeota bacterium]